MKKETTLIVAALLGAASISDAQSKGTTNGLSLILVPKVLPDGRPNGMRVSRVESKLGIHGSPTCVVDFDRAEGVLIGTAGQGFRAMLDLMNNARLGVAAQAVGIAEAAYRAARVYAAERRQFGGPIADQPLMKSMLTQMAINASFGLLIGSGLWLIGVPHPTLWGLVVVILRFIPFVGVPLAAVVPVLLALSVDPGWTMAIATVFLFAVGEV